MKLTVKLGEEHEEEVIVYSRNDSPLIERIDRLIREYNSCEQANENDLPEKINEKTRFTAYADGEILLLSPEQICCFAIQSSKLMAITKDGSYRLKERLFEIEGMLGEGFVKINQSCIVNLKSVKKFDTSLGGALLVILDCGYRDYVSRRQLKIVKKRILK